MNPHFQNMVPMGRGMPGGNMQQMPPNNNSLQLPRYILSTLQSEGPWQGWQAEVPLGDRVLQIRQLVDSLRLLGPPVELQRAVDVALNFERKEFASQPTKEDYLRECQDKLSKIRDQRQQQLRQSVMNGGQNMNMMNANFQQQQMQMRNGMNMQPGMQPGMQAAMQPSQMATPNPNLAQMHMGPNQVMGRMGSMMPNVENNMPQAQNPGSEFTPEDNLVINQRAAELAKSTPKEEMRNIVGRMNPAFRNNLAQKGIDPIRYHFRMLATKEFKQRQAQTNGSVQGQIPNTGTNHNGNGMGNNFGAINQVPNGQQNNANTGLSNTPSQASATPYMPNISHIRGQQEAGLKSQQEGQTVVPASNTTPDQLRLQQQIMLNQQRINQQTNPQVTRELLIQQQRMKAQLNQQQQQQQQQQAAQQRQMQAAQAQNQARAAAAAAAQGNMQNMGQGQNVMQGMGPQNTPMNMLNQPGVPVTQGGSPQPRPQSRAPMPDQQPQMGNQPGSASLQAQLLQNPQQFFARLPPQLQNFLKQRPQNEWLQIIQRYQHTQMQMRRSASQQAGQQPGQQPGQQMANGQFLGPSNIGPSPMQPSLSAGQPNMQTPEARNAIPNVAGQQQPQPQPQQPNLPMNTNPDLMRQQQQQRNMQLQQQNQQRMVGGQQPNSNNENLPKRNLTQPELQFMDQQQIHPQVLRQMQPILASQNAFIPQFKNWLSFKQWLAQNPIAKLTMPVVLNMQANQFQYILRMRQQSMGNAQLTGNPQQNQPQPQPQPQNQNQNQTQSQPQQQQPQSQLQAGPVQQHLPNMPPNMGQMPNMPQQQLRPITDQEIQRIRQSNPRAQNMTDDQLRAVMMRMRASQAQQAMQKSLSQQPKMPPQNQNASQMSVQQTQLGNQHAPTHTQTHPPPQPPQQPSQQTPQQQAVQVNNRVQPNKPQNQPQQPQQQQPQQPQQPQAKNLKRPNQDENTDTSNSNQTNTQSNVNEPARPFPQLSKEQFNSLSDENKAKFLSMVKARQQKQMLQQKINELSRQVQSQMPPTQPLTNMDSASRKRIIAFLTSDATKNMLNRFEPFLMAYCVIENDDKTIKSLLNQRNLLIAQFKPQSVKEKQWEPADNFSITAENVESIVNNMSAKFQQTMAKQTQRQQQQLPLTEKNLKLAQSQTPQPKKSQSSKDLPPPAPTASQPPVQFGDRGQGTPHYAPSQALKQSDLKLDPNKRRKLKDQKGGTTPTAATASPDLKEAGPVTRPFKCVLPNCEYHSVGFMSQEELEQHTRMTHPPETEPITNPLAFLDDAMMQAFDLDEHFQAKKKAEQPTSNAVPMQKTISKAGSNLKMESKPTTPIPMTRGPSQQTGRSNAAATPSLLKTPQSIKAEAKAVTPKQASETKEEPDLWASSNIGLDTLRDTLGDMEWSGEAEQVDLDECVRTYMQGEEWQKVMNGGTLPSSSDGSTDKSKSPGDGSEPSNQSTDAQKANEPAKPTTEIDLSIDGININPDGFEDLIMTESQYQEMDDAWEKIERPSPENRQDLMAPDPFASLDDPEMDAWNNPLYEPLQANGFPDPNSPFEQIDIEEFCTVNGPEVWAAGSMEWNAIGKPGEDARRELGWPIEGAQGFQK